MLQAESVWVEEIEEENANGDEKEYWSGIQGYMLDYLKS